MARDINGRSRGTWKGADYSSQNERRYRAFAAGEPFNDPKAEEDFARRLEKVTEAGVELTEAELTLARIIYLSGRYDGRLSTLRQMGEARRQREGAA